MGISLIRLETSCHEFAVSDMMAIMSTRLNSLLQGLKGHECEFAAGAAVFHVGDAVRVVHFVRQGCIHLARHQEDGAALILQRARAGSILAEASVYSDRYHCDARAESDATTWAVARKDLRRRLEARPEASQVWARHLAQEVQHARLNAEILSLRTVEARLNAWLTLNGALPGKGQRRRIADEIGVSPEAFYRELARRRMP
jgi:CRP/FNR family transcriptional regulator, dissimilatory nitrate respiration regulator